MTTRNKRKKKYHNQAKQDNTPCTNCGEIGSHYVPPCFGDEGFFLCKKKEINIAHNNRCQCLECQKLWTEIGMVHDSDCAIHNMPAYPNAKCNCIAGN